MSTILAERKKIVNYYNQNLNFSRLKAIKIRENTAWNYSYYPVLFESEEQLLATKKVLNDNSVNPRRYFYPSLNTINYVDTIDMPISKSVASRVLCLPLYAGIERHDMLRICNLIRV